MPTRVRAWRRSLDVVSSDVRPLLVREVFSAAHEVFGDFREKFLLSLPPRDVVRGRFHLGDVLYGGVRWPAGLRASELLQNVAVFGRSGAGKTNVAFHLLEQLVRERVPFVFFDWKRTARHFLPDLEAGVEVFTPGRSLRPLPFNPFVPPPGLEAGVYVNHLVDVLGDAYSLGDAARSVVHKALSKLYGDGHPSLQEVVGAVEALPVGSRGKGWKESALRALGALSALNLEVGGSSQREMVRGLSRGFSVVELDGLAPSNKKFLLPLLCLWLYYLKLGESSRERLSLVLFFEEAHHFLYARRGSESLMEMLMRQCREIGVGIVVVDQHPSLISSAVLGNTYATLLLNLKDPRDVSKAAALSLLSSSEKRFFGLLPVGVGVVKLQDRWKHSFLVRFPHVRVRKGVVSDEDLREGRFHGVSALSDAGRGYFRERGEVWRSRFVDEPLGDGELSFLWDVLSHPLSGVDARYKRLGVSVERGHGLKQGLVGRGFLEEETLVVGGSRRKALRVAPVARSALGLEKVVGRESLVHEYWKRWHAARLERSGYRVWVEAPRRVGRVDVLAFKDGKSLAVEVETGRSTVVWNVKQDLLSGYERVLVVATSIGALERVEAQLGRAGLLSSRVEVVLRGG